ncbi:aminotransferase class V-fold PLP-dependent enzyme [Alteromonas sp. C1M14]|uniref:aminotransferase class V-fold PLP-dependent enzyme n=1 Tax=Alteromonas sp. C1M14 TaxID=2841567 RepID=UPI001C08D1CB|nr:aminotransferase class V-fold PLP-dependent enzyme [Alteromonas sp. C1M14]MBU2976729.1 aminotransferase class V-fold PLP-dependent enzyme [Alteromonas sp. C1M14]
MNSRRHFLKLSASLSTVSLTGLATANTITQGIPDPSKSSFDLARDENHWQQIRALFPVQDELINLEHGYWGKMATVVEDALATNTHRINKELSWYARTQYKSDFLAARKSVASALNANVNELMLTRNATESFVNLITQYKGLESTDAILWADSDYPSFQKMMAWLAKEHNVKGHKITLPAAGTHEDYINVYKQAFDRMPNLKLMLLTHVSNQHGLVLPVKAISEMAKARGIQVICDCAQSWGLLDFTVDDIGADWAVFNLHKWIGSPVGVGALYMRTGTMAPVSPFPGEDPNDEDVANRVHLATSDFAAFITVPKALAVHQAIGGSNKEARLTYLRDSWVNEVQQLPQVEILGAKETDNASGMGGFRLRHATSKEAVSQLQSRLQNEFGIFTVLRDSLTSGCCIRVTPQIFTPISHIHALSDAIKTIASTQ